MITDLNLSGANKTEVFGIKRSMTPAWINDKSTFYRLQAASRAGATQRGASAHGRDVRLRLALEESPVTALADSGGCSHGRGN